MLYDGQAPTGLMLIGKEYVKGTDGKAIYGVAPATNEQIEPAFPGASQEMVARACDLAAAAFPIYRDLPLETRAKFLETIAAKIEALGPALVERVMLETGLPKGRVEGERGRTCGQLRLFAKVVRDGSFLDLRIDPAMPDRKPLPRVDLRLRNVALGPVGVFGASNFPLAFSVAGGDTASALAAGCPVIVKAHSAHPGTSAMVGQAIADAVTEMDMPEGVFSLVFGSGSIVGQELVSNAHIKAIGFTGSRNGGMALAKTAFERAEPIPVYAEMSAVNPVILFPGALKARGEAIGKSFSAALQLGAGQFCTNPGLLLAIEGEGLDAFIAGAREAISASPAQVMLTPGIYSAYAKGVEHTASLPGAKIVAKGQEPTGPNQGQAILFETTLEHFEANPGYGEEMFGSASILVRVPSAEALAKALQKIEGQLTIALHIEGEDHDLARAMLPTIETKAGRVLVNGFGTGVEVCDAMVHGGPFPATSDPHFTSVGTLAIRRFIRPVSYQDLPDALLAPELKAENPLKLPRLVDGVAKAAQ